MGIGRREFLRICGQAFAAVAAVATDSVVVVDDLYVNRRLGIAFRKPPGWRFTDIKPMEQLAEGQILASEDTKFSPDMLAWLGLPFVVIERDSEATQGFTPNAQFYLVEDCPLLAELDALMDELGEAMGEFPSHPLGAAEMPPMLTKANEDREACSQLFNSFTTIDEPTTLTLSGCPSAAYTAAWLYQHVDLPVPRRIRVKTIFTLHGKLTYLIRLTDSPYGNPADSFAFETFLSSIAFV